MAAKNPPPIKYTFDADARKFAQGAAKVEQDLKQIDRQAKNTDKALDLNVKVDDSALDALRRRLLEAKLAVENDIRTDVDIDPTEALRNLQRIENQLRALDRMDVHPEVKVDVDRSIGDVMGRIRSHMDGLSDSARSLAGTLPVVGESIAALGPYGLAAAAGVAALGAALVGPGLIGAATAAPALLAAKGLLEAYDEIDKGNRKAKIVFGNNLKEVRKWARGLSTNVGLGEKEIIAASAAIQDLLVPQGFKRAEAAQITEEIYERGAALAEFSGLDTSQGVEAVTAALLGARKQLKGLGVDITAAEVKQRVALLKGSGQYEGFTDKMLTTAATMDLLKEKSGDAWTAFNQGGSEADTLLDKFNSTIANLKTDAIEGFGGILVDIVADLRAVGDVDFGGFTSLGDWINANKDSIRRFFVDLALYVGNAALAALDLGRALTTAMVDTAPLIAEQVKVAGQLAAMLQRAAGAALLVVPGMQKTGLELLRTAGNTSDMADAVADAYKNMAQTFGPSVLKGMEKVRGGIQGVVDDLELLQQVDEFKVAVLPQLKAGAVDDVKGELADLSEDQLVALVATLDPKSGTKTERELRKLAEKRLAHVVAVADTRKAQKELDKLAGSSTHTVHVVVKNPYTGATGKLPFPGSDRSASAAPQFSRTAAARSVAPMAAGPADTSSTLAVAAAPVAFNPVVNNYYPKPERASDSIASSLRVARYLAGV